MDLICSRTRSHKYIAYAVAKFLLKTIIHNVALHWFHRWWTIDFEISIRTIAPIDTHLIHIHWPFSTGPILFLIIIISDSDNGPTNIWYFFHDRAIFRGLWHRVCWSTGRGIHRKRKRTVILWANYWFDICENYGSDLHSATFNKPQASDPDLHFNRMISIDNLNHLFSHRSDDKNVYAQITRNQKSNIIVVRYSTGVDGTVEFL